MEGFRGSWLHWFKLISIRSNWWMLAYICPVLLKGKHVNYYLITEIQIIIGSKSKWGRGLWSFSISGLFMGTWFYPSPPFVCLCPEIPSFFLSSLAKSSVGTTVLTTLCTAIAAIVTISIREVRCAFQTIGASNLVNLETSDAVIPINRSQIALWFIARRKKKRKNLVIWWSVIPQDQKGG